MPSSFQKAPLQGSAGKDANLELPLQGILHLLVTEAIDEGIEHGNYDGVEDRHHLAIGITRGSVRLDIGENHGAIENGNGQKVGGTRGEGLLPPSCGAHPPNGQQDQAVGGEDDCSRQKGDQSREDIEDPPCCGCVGTSQAEKGWDVTEVVCYLVGPTEWQGKDIPSLDSRVGATECIGSSCQLETGPLGHDRAVMEGSADGHEAVVRHGGQQEALRCHM